MWVGGILTIIIKNKTKMTTWFSSWLSVFYGEVTPAPARNAYSPIAKLQPAVSINDLNTVVLRKVTEVPPPKDPCPFLPNSPLRELWMRFNSKQLATEE